QDPGFYKVNWKPINLPSGVYFCKLTIGDRASTQKLILLK
ncbi:MAG: T9SS type A sorting domain-containing protein, partial [Candidatus Marinimicrobia bacterium]|nr:T9SS type A sorting domain-containing protein [Candidatus Neomarinimicrobiota bacterium]